MRAGFAPQVRTRPSSTRATVTPAQPNGLAVTAWLRSRSGMAQRETVAAVFAVVERGQTSQYPGGYYGA